MLLDLKFELGVDDRRDVRDVGRARVAQMCSQTSPRVQCCTGLAHEGKIVYSYFRMMRIIPPR